MHTTSSVGVGPDDGECIEAADMPAAQLHVLHAAPSSASVVPCSGGASHHVHLQRDAAVTFVPWRVRETSCSLNFGGFGEAMREKTNGASQHVRGRKNLDMFDPYRGMRHRRSHSISLNPLINACLEVLKTGMTVCAIDVMDRARRCK